MIKLKEECFRKGDCDHVNRGIRVLLLDEKNNPIGHADWRIVEAKKWVIANGNKPSISHWIMPDNDIPNLDLKEPNWTNGIDIQEEFQEKRLGKLLIALRLLLLKRYHDQDKEVFIDLQGNQKERVQQIYQFFIPKYQEIYSQITGNNRTQRILIEQIDWNRVYAIINEWLI